MMTLMAQLCALCAMIAVMQMLVPQEGRDSVKLIGGLAMLHLVMSCADTLCAQILAQRDLAGIFGVFVQ